MPNSSERRFDVLGRERHQITPVASNAALPMAAGTRPRAISADGAASGALDASQTPAIFGDVFVEQDASLGIAQQLRQRGLTVGERAIVQILAVMLDQVEGVQDRGSQPPIGTAPRSETSRRGLARPPRRRSSRSWP
jgi:hypothetical protein